MYHLEKQTIERQEIVLTNDQVNYLGHDLVLDHCRVIIRASGQNLVIARTKLLNCQIEIRRQLTNFWWDAAQIEGCTFQGKLRGNYFGHQPSTGTSSWGSIQDCDFTAAILDDCRFVGCDIKTIKLPSWPCFTMLDPHQNAAFFQDATLPASLRSWARYNAGQPMFVVAVSSYAPTILERSGGTEDEIKTFLEKLEFIRL